MERVNQFSEDELSREDKDKINELTKQSKLYPSTWSEQNFPNKDDLLRVLKLALTSKFYFIFYIISIQINSIISPANLFYDYFIFISDTLKQQTGG